MIPGGTEFHGSLNLQVVYHKAARDWANDTLWLLGRPLDGRLDVGIIGGSSH